MPRFATDIVIYYGSYDKQVACSEVSIHLHTKLCSPLLNSHGASNFRSKPTSL